MRGSSSLMQYLRTCQMFLGLVGINIYIYIFTVVSICYLYILLYVYYVYIYIPIISFSVVRSLGQHVCF